MWRPDKIISCGETGAEIGGLVGAQRCNIPTGGCAANGFVTERGRQPILRTRFGLVTHLSPLRNDCIAENLSKADATIIFTNNPTLLAIKHTVEACEELKRPFLTLCTNLEKPNSAEQEVIFDPLGFFVEQHRPVILFITGDLESESPGIAKKSARIIATIFNNSIAQQGVFHAQTKT